MKIGIFGSAALHPLEQEYTVSGHAQLPLKTAALLSERGFNVDMITTEADDNYGLPSFVPNSVNLKTVPNVFETSRGGDTKIWRYPSFFSDIRRVIRDGDYDKIHFFGSGRVDLLHRVLSRTGIESESYQTIVNHTSDGGLMNRLRHSFDLDYLYFPTEYTKGKYLSDVPEVERCGVTRPGIIREFKSGSPDVPFDNFVLFWRNAHPRNGVDITETVFTRLSDQYPSREFVFAVRHNDVFEPELERSCSRISNMHLLRYPYSDGITIESLLTQADVIVLPFRKLSINPQMSILESLASGTPLVTTRVESNPEVIADGQTAHLAQPDPDDVEEHLVDLLESQTKRKKMGKKAKKAVSERWNWKKYIEHILEGYNI